MARANAARTRSSRRRGRVANADGGNVAMEPPANAGEPPALPGSAEIVRLRQRRRRLLLRRDAHAVAVADEGDGLPGKLSVRGKRRARTWMTPSTFWMGPSTWRSVGGVNDAPERWRWNMSGTTTALGGPGFILQREEAESLCSYPGRCRTITRPAIFVQRPSFIFVKKIDGTLHPVLGQLVADVRHDMWA